MSKVKDNTVDDEIDIMGLLQAILYRWWIVLMSGSIINWLAVTPLYT